MFAAELTDPAPSLSTANRPFWPELRRAGESNALIVPADWARIWANVAAGSAVIGIIADVAASVVAASKP